MRYLLYICIIISAYCFTACDANEEYPYPIPEKVLVGECIFEEGQNFYVKVFLPNALNDTSDFEIRPDCKVEIQAPGVSTDVLHYDAIDKRYESSPLYKAQPGKFYKLKIEDPEYGLITADDILPQEPVVNVSPISSIKLKSTSSNGNLFIYEIDVDLPLSDGLTPLYYNILLTERLKQKSNGNIIERRAEIINIGESASNTEILYHKGGVLIEGESDAKSNLKLKMSCAALESPGIDSLIDVKLDVRSTSQNYFQFYNSVDLQVKQASNPFESPSPLYSNFKNGLGIFAGYSSEKLTLAIPTH